MKKITSIQSLSFTLNTIEKLQKISRSIHTLDTHACNYGLTERQEKRLSNLIVSAEELAKTLGLKVYHQGDPRGCSLYLIEEDQDDTNYHDGIPLC